MTRTKVLTAAGVLLLLLITGLLTTLGAIATIRRAAFRRLYDRVESVPANDVDLVLGTYSVVRARRVFGQTRLPIITDRFHAGRAIFLARHAGTDAAAFPSAEMEPRYSARSRLRECFADVKACLDLWVLHTRPRFLGEPIPVRVADR